MAQWVIVQGIAPARIILKRVRGWGEMWPKLREWKKWSTLDRVNYVALFLAPIALIVSSVFSYLSWTEARRAQEIQERIFSAQSGPILRMSNVNITRDLNDGTIVVMTFQNVGESDAVEACAHIVGKYGWGEPLTCDSIIHSIPPQPISKGSSVVHNRQVDDYLAKHIGFVPNEAFLADHNGDRNDACQPDHASDVASIFFEYRDVLGRERQGSSAILLCGPKITTSEPLIP